MTIVYVSAQKTNITDAAVLMKKYNPMGGEKSVKLVNEAKGFIDKAAAHPETSESMKMHYYRGMIYFALVELESMKAMSGKTPDEDMVEKYSEISKESFLKVVNDPDKRKGYQQEAKGFIETRVKQFWSMGLSMYESKNYEMAMMGFMGAYEVKKFINEEYEDAKMNSQYMLQGISDSLLNHRNIEYKLAEENMSSEKLEMLKDFEKGSEVYLEKMEEFAKELEKENLNKVEDYSLKYVDIFGIDTYVLNVLINTNLKQNDKENSEKYIKQALDLDPNNKELYWIMGTSNIEQKEYEKAEQNLLKAIEIDSMYLNAHSNLAALYMDWSLELADEAQDLDYRDPRVEELKKQKTDLLVKAIPSLEIMAVEFPDNKSVIRNLASAYRASGNEEKFQEWYGKLKN
jgi:tetratricopeptide (TPR) repeat protein